MILSDHQIRDLALNDALIDGYREEHLNPASYDLTLSPVLRVARPSDEPLDVAAVEPGYTDRVVMGEDGFVLQPDAFLLAATNETVRLPEYLVARVEGKSSLGRIALTAHVTAGYVDPLFRGSITLEVANLLGRPILLRPNMRIAQLAFTYMATNPVNGYEVRGHYQGQPAGEPVESRFRM